MFASTDLSALRASTDLKAQQDARLRLFDLSLTLTCRAERAARGGDKAQAAALFREADFTLSCLPLGAAERTAGTGFLLDTMRLVSPEGR
jgi:hypothetical protein